MLKAKDIMTKEVITVRRDTTVRDLAQLFAQHRISTVPVVDEGGLLVGIVSESDLIEQDKNLHIPTVVSIFDWVIYLESDKRFEKELQKMTAQTVGEIYAEEVFSVGPESPVSEVADIMTSKRIQAVPVVEGRRVVGIIGRIDMVKTMIG
ncbi:CBS domain pair-containing protein [Citrifermentans bemidjiense Bem]|uniref:CBS domain pair-containing protein n=1 Tax=Citrifermentans bemidjiense (strain ATCC BAA-1014 / DSM 16622 / JCM 12645 / Bem) TaxID=404380 RepID=B5EI17_CITBB|nr:CBS domain-containing protein [Citrifermentans bemidjiense]ACH38281.1 CBS domain pair-containing protein [Citrifermentans bemidjiense Bem]